MNPSDTEILEFLLNQFKPHSLKMNGESDWCYRVAGQPEPEYDMGDEK